MQPRWILRVYCLYLPFISIHSISIHCLFWCCLQCSLRSKLPKDQTESGSFFTFLQQLVTRKWSNILICLSRWLQKTMLGVFFFFLMVKCPPMCIWVCVCVCVCVCVWLGVVESAYICLLHVFVWGEKNTFSYGFESYAQCPVFCNLYCWWVLLLCYVCELIVHTLQKQWSVASDCFPCI